MGRIGIIRSNLIDHFEKLVRPHIIEENKDNIDIFIDLMKKFHPKFYYIVVWYDDTLRISTYVSAIGMQYFMTGTIDGKDPYDFEDNPAPSINK